MTKIVGALSIFIGMVILSNVFGSHLDSAEKDKVAADDEVSPEKLEATLKKLLENLKKQGYTDEELLGRDERDTSGQKRVRKSYEEEFKDTCGGGPLGRCSRELKPPPGHVCDDVAPLEPKGPFCNCAVCSGHNEPKKQTRETDFDEMEALKSEEVKIKRSIYEEKWKPANRNEKPKKADSGFQSTSDEESKKTQFSCLKTEPIFDVGKTPVCRDPAFEEQLQSISENEDHPSQGILKYQEKIRREEGEL